MRTIKLFFFLAAAFFACTNLYAQVTIGGLDDPRAGALLDLNSGAKGGLLLSNVSITNLNKIPTGTNSFPGIIAGDNDGNNPGFKGAIVYNTNPDTGIGVYVWTGTQWIPAGTNILYDAEGNDYTIGNFGGAGWWMTQNLRSTQYDDGNGTGEILTVGFNSTDGSLKYYDYPSIDNTILSTHPEYGLLYSWAAASGRTESTPGTDTYGFESNLSVTHHQGICPANWHLPSDYEWSQLEIEIALHPEKYSSQDDAYTFANGSTYDDLYTTMGKSRPEFALEPTYWGRQMKSTTGVPSGTASNSSSKSREKGGFDALLVGSVISSGTANSYGSVALFWSSSSYDSFGVYRGLVSNDTGMTRSNAYRYRLFSVRCKKD